MQHAQVLHQTKIGFDSSVDWGASSSLSFLLYVVFTGDLKSWATVSLFYKFDVTDSRR